MASVTDMNDSMATNHASDTLKFTFNGKRFLGALRCLVSQIYIYLGRWCYLELWPCLKKAPVLSPRRPKQAANPLYLF
jgi:hypothetical protein